jgi:hypothetical protein
MVGHAGIIGQFDRWRKILTFTQTATLKTSNARSI